MAPATTRGRRTEQAFKQAALRVFAEKGYLNARVADIAAAAGRSTASFYNYYDNKEAILDALSTEYSRELIEQSDRLEHHRGDPRQNIRDIVALYWNTYRRHLPVIIGVFQLSMTDPAVARRWKENRQEGVRKVLGGIDRARLDGYLSGLDSQTVASALVAMLEFYCWTWLAGDGELGMARPDDETAIDTLAAVWYRTVYFDEHPRGGPAAP